MASTLHIASPARQPFGNIESPRLRNLANLKNRQNAIPTQPSGALKRRHPPPELSDSENVDPSLLKSSSKRKRTENDNLAKPEKPAPFALKVITHKSAPAPVIQTPKRLDTPHSHTPSKGISIPTSAPPAGRSPKAKNRVGILNRRRTTSAPFKRIDPPVFTKPTSNAAPFSIAAALMGATSSYKGKPAPVHTIGESVPKSWVFEIHEDTEADEMSNLMEHSTQTLDISDDEGKATVKNERGKENIPPTELEAINIPMATRVTTAPTSRKDIMTGETRTPLGDLNAADFYAEGCDASSYFIIGGEDSTRANNAALNPDPTFDSALACKKDPAPVMAKSDIAALIHTTMPSNEKTDAPVDQNNSIAQATDAEIEIWESGSAADDEQGDRSPRDNIFIL